jgi:hypothetical protein
MSNDIGFRRGQRDEPRDVASAWVAPGTSYVATVLDGEGDVVGSKICASYEQALDFVIERVSGRVGFRRTADFQRDPESIRRLLAELKCGYDFAITPLELEGPGPRATARPDFVP